MENEKPCQIRNAAGPDHIFANLEIAERVARSFALPRWPVDIWQDGKIIARVSADMLKRTRMNMYG